MKGQKEPTKQAYKPFNDGSGETYDDDIDTPGVTITSDHPYNDSDSNNCFPCAGDKRRNHGFSCKRDNERILRRLAVKPQ